MKLYIATTNQHKQKELERLFPGFDLALPMTAGVSFHYEESETNFLENAFGKATALFDSIRKPVLADDSGLSVNYLGGAPGVLSSRFGMQEKGKMLSDSEKVEYLLEKMSGADDRRAHFICCMVIILDVDIFFIAQEVVEGQIAHQPKGGGGFGYDPIFYLPEYGKTAAELTGVEKDSISHRGKAAKALAEIEAVNRFFDLS